MIAGLAAWWRARTSRERLLLRVVALLAFAVLAPFWGWQAASSYRASAAAELAAARDVEANVAKLAAAAPETPATPAPAGDDTLRGLALATAQEGGLEIARVEPAGPDRIRVVFAPTDSLRVYRWMDSVIRRGAYVSRTAIVRAQEGDQVIAEFEVAPSP